MFLIGAPLGGIIKKGGFGLPVVISIILFISYHIISITGEKLVKKCSRLFVWNMGTYNFIFNVRSSFNI